MQYIPNLYTLLYTFNIQYLDMCNVLRSLNRYIYLGNYLQPQMICENNFRKVVSYPKGMLYTNIMLVCFTLRCYLVFHICAIAWHT